MYRPLHTVELTPPDYKVPSGWNLVDSYIEKEVKVHTNLNMQNKGIFILKFPSILLNILQS